ncbi:MAG: sigma-70 family RNA polymerase sigma factor [Solirubrobacterales bacterium]
MRAPGELKRRLGGRREEREVRRLAAALRSGEEGAIAAVEERYGKTLSGFLRQALPDAASAEEVRQQVLLEVWRRGPEYDPDRSSPLTWILTIARSRAIDELRRRRPEPIDPVQLPESEERDPALDEMLERWRLSDLLRRIPGEEALLLRLRFYADKSQTEIAAETGLPLGTVKHRMVAGLGRLRTLMIEEGAA